MKLWFWVYTMNTDYEHKNRNWCVLYMWGLITFYCLGYYSSVQFSCSVVSDSLRPPESQHTRPPCPSSTPGLYSNSCPSSRWCHPAISSSVIPFPSCPQSLPASGSFPMSQLFPWGGQSIGVSASSMIHFDSGKRIFSNVFLVTISGRP